MNMLPSCPVISVWPECAFLLMMGPTAITPTHRERNGITMNELTADFQRRLVFRDGVSSASPYAVRSAQKSNYTARADSLSHGHPDFT